MTARASWERRRAVVLHAAGTSTPLPAYRVEHRVGQQLVADPARIEGVCPHHVVLAPFMAALRLKRVTQGKVVLLEAGSGQMVARRMVAPLRRRAA